jgi:hypothetical protein
VASSPTALYRENTTDVPVLGQGRLAVALNQKGDLYKARIQLELPVMEEATAQNSAGYTAAPKVAHTVRADLTLFAHSRSTEQLRVNLITLLKNALDDAQVKGTFTSLLKPF